MTTRNIRIATFKDYPAILAIYNQAVFTKRCTADLDEVSYEARLPWIQYHLNTPMYPIYVMEESSTILGWCSLSPYRKGRRALDRTAEISYYIHDQHFRKGVATSLITHTIAECEGLGIKTLIALILEVNQVSVELLVQKAGFQRWGYIPHAADLDGVVCGHCIVGREL
eukprot:gnl/Dysnectes_brevis/4149_a5466_1091.p1 GENE.gnl/Dysnectes_brevis/4149_a5466_1091~~gnl/Dysnectes_brevis/4149_a5466_1091.p1  ORF type:complete len:169 (-),score=0.10 gnl/Dysnectes_brevis/4149_a5466_1091:302-808(-)